MKLSELALLVGGELRGDPDYQVVGISSPQKPKERTAVFCQSKKEAERLLGLDLVVVCSEVVQAKNLLVVKDVKLALARFLEHFYPERHPSGISEKAHIDEDVYIGKDVYIGPFVYVGKGAVLEDGVKVYPFCYIGEGVRSWKKQRPF